MTKQKVTDISKKIGATMKSAIYNAGDTQQQAADKLELNYISTLNNYLNGQREIPRPLVEKFSKEYNVPLNKLYPELYEIQINKIPIVGAVEAGAWHEACQWPESEWEYINYATNDNLKNKRIFALRVHGNSMNKVFRPDNTVLVCCDVYECDTSPINGDYVIVERHNRDGLCEATVKRYNKLDDDTVVLEAESTDPRYTNIVLHPDDNEYQIKAIVIDVQMRLRNI